MHIFVRAHQHLTYRSIHARAHALSHKFERREGVPPSFLIVCRQINVHAQCTQGNVVDLACCCDDNKIKMARKPKKKQKENSVG